MAREDEDELSLTAVEELGRADARRTPMTRVQFFDHFGLSVDDFIRGCGYSASGLYGVYLKARTRAANPPLDHSL